MNQDESNLRSLATAFRVLGGIYSALYVVGGIALFGFTSLIVHESSGIRDPEGPMMMAGPTALMAWSLLVAGIVFGILAFVTASSLDRQKNYALCIGISIFSLLIQPLGLVLGILALIVLCRPSVRALFQAQNKRG